MLLLALACVLASVADAAHAQPANGETNPPNIVLIVADDLGYGDLGAYGQQKIQTPRLDEMAREGMTFRQFYAGSTVCAPSRSVLLTGRHAGRTPVRGNRPVYSEDSSVVVGQEPLPDEAVTVAEMLQEAGYATGAFGKWGLGGIGTEGVPWQQGFDTFFGYLDQWRAHFYYPEFLYRNDERVPLAGNEVAETRTGSGALIPGAGQPSREAVYSHDRIADEALQFVEAHQDDPFFLYMPLTIPHLELLAPPDAMARYQNAAGKSVFAPETPHPSGHHYSPQEMPRAAYAAMISRMDRDVGRLLDTLEALGLDENTLVLFTSDNGPVVGRGGADPVFFDSNGPLRGFKRDFYEGGIRVPMVAWGPGRVPAGAESHHTSYFGDFLATFAEAAGTEAPEPNDSVSMLPALRGQPGQQQAHDYLYWEFYGPSVKQAVRAGRWKAIRDPMPDGPVRLYDLQKDLSERRDVAAEHPEVVAEMERIMREAHTPSSLWEVSSAK
jgi:arylsulfatase A-like enzyme